MDESEACDYTYWAVAVPATLSPVYTVEVGYGDASAAHPSTPTEFCFVQGASASVGSIPAGSHMTHTSLVSAPDGRITIAGEWPACSKLSWVHISGDAGASAALPPDGITAGRSSWWPLSEDQAHDQECADSAPATRWRIVVTELAPCDGGDDSTECQVSDISLVAPLLPPVSVAGGIPCAGGATLAEEIEGTIDFYDGYANRAECSWTIACPARLGTGVVPRLAFTQLDTEQSHDWVDIHDGMDATGQRLAHLSGSTLPAGSFRAEEGSTVTVRFTSDGSVGGQGFVASYSCAQCDPTQWTNVDNGIICDGSTGSRLQRDCAALIHFDESPYSNCAEFCAGHQLTCVGQYIDDADSCTTFVGTDGGFTTTTAYEDIGCASDPNSSDNICECGPLTVAIPGASIVAGEVVPPGYTQAALDAEDALPDSAISDGNWGCAALLEWQGPTVCTDESGQHYDWAQNCPINCLRVNGGELRSEETLSTHVVEFELAEGQGRPASVRISAGSSSTESWPLSFDLEYADVADSSSPQWQLSSSITVGLTDLAAGEVTDVPLEIDETRCYKPTEPLPSVAATNRDDSCDNGRGEWVDSGHVRICCRHGAVWCRKSATELRKQLAESDDLGDRGEKNEAWASDQPEYWENLCLRLPAAPACEPTSSLYMLAAVAEGSAVHVSSPSANNVLYRNAEFIAVLAAGEVWQGTGSSGDVFSTTKPGSYAIVDGSDVIDGVDVFTEHLAQACSGRNELGEQSLGDLDGCKQYCLDTAGCISFEYSLTAQDAGTCQFSTSCTCGADGVCTATPGEWNMYTLDGAAAFAARPFVLTPGELAGEHFTVLTPGELAEVHLHIYCLGSESHTSSLSNPFRGCEVEIEWNAPTTSSHLSTAAYTVRSYRVRAC
jgi:hypothetical protein|eukprot:COSAG06_NODE_2476_length_6797_cov_2.011795_8_plen_893_part_00